MTSASRMDERQSRGVADGLQGARVLITGADGMLGRAFADALRDAPSVAVHARSHAMLDVTDRGAVLREANTRPDIIVHCAAMTNAEACERDPARAREVQVTGTMHVAELANATAARVLYPQSVFIFDGESLPLTEETTPTPPFVYGQVKWEAEQLLRKAVPDALVVRMAGFFGGDDKDKNFVGQFARALVGLLERGEDSIAVGKRIWQPTYTRDLAENCVLLLSHGCRGVYHMGALDHNDKPAAVSFFDVASECVAALGLAAQIRIIPAPNEPFDVSERARRPMRMVTRNDRLVAEGLCRQRDWVVALREYLARPWFDHVRHAAI